MNENYLKVKKKLEHLQYNYPLGIESVQLAEKLLNDLVRTTKGFHEIMGDRDKLKEQLESEKQTPLPLRNENAKLMKENNELHRELIKLKEEMDLTQSSLSGHIKKIESEKEEAKFLLQQKEIHIKSIETESEGLRRKMNELVNKVYGTGDRDHSTTNSINYKYGLPNAEKILKTKTSTMNIIGKNHEMQMTKGLDSNPSFDNLLNTGNKKSLINEMTHSSAVNKEEWANDLRLADERAEKFRSDIRRLEEEKNNFISKIEFLERQIINRDLEIRRIQNTFLNTDNIEELKIRYQSDNMKSTIEKLNSQIDFLNNENNKLKEISNFREITGSNTKTKSKEEEFRKLEKDVINLKKEKEILNRRLETFEKGNIENEKEGWDTGNTHKDKKLLNANRTETHALELENNNNKVMISRLSEELKHLNSTSNSEKMILLNSIEQLKKDFKTVSNTLNDKNKDLDETLKSVQQLQTELNFIKSRELIQTQNNLSTADNVSHIYKEYNELLITSKDVHRKLKEIESENLKLTKEKVELINLNENLQQIKLKLEKSQNLNLENNSAFKSHSMELNSTIERQENQINILEMKLKLQSEELQNINEILINKTSLIKELETKNNNYFKQLQDSESNSSLIQVENRNLSNEITELLNKIKIQSEKLRSYEREYNEHKYVKDKVNEYEEKEKLIKIDLRTLERENKVMKTEIMRVNESLTLARDEIEHLAAHTRTLEEDKKKLIAELELNTNELCENEETLKNLNVNNKEMSENRRKISELNSKILSMKSEIEKLTSDFTIKECELKKKTSETIKHNETILKLNSDILELKARNSTLEEALDKYKNDLLRFDASTVSNNQIMMNLLETKDQLEKQLQEKCQIQAENKILLDKSQLAQTEKSALEVKISNMTNLINDIDKTRGEMLEKLQNELNKNRTNENEILLLNENRRKNEIELNNLKDVNTELTSGIASLNANFDNISNELDVKTEEISKLNLLVQNLQVSNEELTKKISHLLNKGNTDNKRLVERENELHQLKYITDELEKENKDLKSTLNIRCKEIQDLNHDLRCLQSENQSILEELSVLAKDNEKLALVKSQLEKNSDLISQRFRSNESDLNDIYSQYKEVCQERERLQQNLKIFIDENKLAAGYIKQVESNLQNYKSNVANVMMEKENLSKKIDFLEKYNSELTNEISRLKDELSFKGDEQLVLKKTNAFDKEINLNYENHMARLTQQIAYCESEKKTLSDKLNNANNRIEYMNHNKNQNEKSLKNMEDIINCERIKLHALNINNQKLREELNLLKDENKRIVKMINENKDIRELKTKILEDAVVNMNNSRESKSSNVNVMGNRPENFLISETFSSGEENAILKRLINDLNNQIEDLQKNLKTVREENTRLMSERSINNNILSERNMSERNSSINSNHSMSR